MTVLTMSTVIRHSFVITCFVKGKEQMPLRLALPEVSVRNHRGETAIFHAIR
jgi:hypothetical protein